MKFIFVKYLKYKLDYNIQHIRMEFNQKKKKEKIENIKENIKFDK